MSDVWRFSENTKEWEELKSEDGEGIPEARSVHGFASLKERGVIVCLYGERDPSPMGHVGAGKYVFVYLLLSKLSWDELLIYLVCPSQVS